MTNLEKTTTITTADLAGLGMRDVAYVKRVTDDEGPAYSIHAADGTPLAVLPEWDIAVAAVRQHGLEPVSVH